MKASVQRPATPDRLFLWVMHRFGEVFGLRAVIKGGMALRLLDCPRSTTDIDYVFAPYGSKRDIEGAIREVLLELEGAQVEIAIHSTMLRATLALDGTSIQIEATVAEDCASEAVATAELAHRVGQPSHVVLVQRPSQALSHKLAAWNERRLFRDLYDVYFLNGRVGAEPDVDVLRARLAKVRLQVAKPRGKRSMSLAEFCRELLGAAHGLDQALLEEELAPLLPETELVGLNSRIRVALVRVGELLERHE
jgi:predicted nucleotidyltransferase component of viral defense system